MYVQIGRIDGVILLNWTLTSLERQIEYGARQGEIDLEMAKIELRNFRRNVIPVAEYFDYKQLLYVVCVCNVVHVNSRPILVPIEPHQRLRPTSSN